MLSLIHRVAAAGLIVALVGLLVADAISWRRTRALRDGRPSPMAGSLRRGPPGLALLGSRGARSSRTTFLAGAAGLWALAYGATPTCAGGWGSPAFVAAGGFVAVTGLVGRVRTLRAGRAALVVCFAARPALVLSWESCLELQPPRTPFGGWRVIGSHVSRSLMPSDVLCNEWLLAAIIDAAGLSFQGRRWMRGPCRQVDG
jgi:hypothetical protein